MTSGHKLLPLDTTIIRWGVSEYQYQNRSTEPAASFFHKFQENEMTRSDFAAAPYGVAIFLQGEKHATALLLSDGESELTALCKIHLQ